jgi:hypothetical protein
VRVRILSLLLLLPAVSHRLGGRPIGRTPDSGTVSDLRKHWLLLILNNLSVQSVPVRAHVFLSVGSS